MKLLLSNGFDISYESMHRVFFFPPNYTIFHFRYANRLFSLNDERKKSDISYTPFFERFQ